MTKKSFDLALLVVLLAKPATGILRLAARRWSDETSGSLKTIGDAVQVAL